MAINEDYKKVDFNLFSTVYELPFYDTKIPRGFYTIHLTLTGRNEGKLIGLTDNIVCIKDALFVKISFLKREICYLD